jgi:hypothetical protein
MPGDTSQYSPQIPGGIAESIKNLQQTADAAISAVKGPVVSRDRWDVERALTKASNDAYYAKKAADSAASTGEDWVRKGIDSFEMPPAASAASTVAGATKSAWNLTTFGLIVSEVSTIIFWLLIPIILYFIINKIANICLSDEKVSYIPYKSFFDDNIVSLFDTNVDDGEDNWFTAHNMNKDLLDPWEQMTSGNIGNIGEICLTEGDRDVVSGMIDNFASEVSDFVNDHDLSGTLEGVVQDVAGPNGVVATSLVLEETVSQIFGTDITDESGTSDTFYWESPSAVSDELDEYSECGVGMYNGSEVLGSFKIKKCYLQYDENPDITTGESGSLNDLYEAGHEPIMYNLPGFYEGVRNDENRFVSNNPDRFTHKQRAINSGDLIDVCDKFNQVECESQVIEGPESNKEGTTCIWTPADTGTDGSCKWRESPACSVHHGTSPRECDNVDPTTYQLTCRYNTNDDKCETIPVYELSDKYDPSIPGRLNDNDTYIGCKNDYNIGGLNTGIIQSTLDNCNPIVIGNIKYTRGDQAPFPTIDDDEIWSDVDDICYNPPASVPMVPTRFKTPYCYTFRDPINIYQDENNPSQGFYSNDILYDPNRVDDFMMDSCILHDEEELCNDDNNNNCLWDSTNSTCAADGSIYFHDVQNPTRICIPTDIINCENKDEDVCTHPVFEQFCQWDAATSSCSEKECTPLDETACNNIDLLNDRFSEQCTPLITNQCPEPSDDSFFYGSNYPCNKCSEDTDANPACPENYTCDIATNQCMFNCNSSYESLNYACPNCSTQGGNDNKQCFSATHFCLNNPDCDTDPSLCEGVCISNDIGDSHESELQGTLCFADISNESDYTYWNFGRFTPSQSTLFSEPMLGCENTTTNTYDELYQSTRGFSPIIQTVVPLDDISSFDSDNIYSGITEEDQLIIDTCNTQIQTDSDHKELCRLKRYHLSKDTLLNLRKKLNINIPEDGYISETDIIDISSGISKIGSVHPCANEDAYFTFVQNLMDHKNSGDADRIEYYKKMICILNTTNLPTTNGICQPLTSNSVQPTTTPDPQQWITAGEPGDPDDKGNMLDQLCFYDVQYETTPGGEGVRLSDIQYGPIPPPEAGFVEDRICSKCKKYTNDLNTRCNAQNCVDGSQSANTEYCNDDGSCNCESFNSTGSQNNNNYYLGPDPTDPNTEKCLLWNECANNTGLIYIDDNKNEVITSKIDETDISSGDPICDCRESADNVLHLFGSKCDKYDDEINEDNSCHGKLSEYEFSYDGIDYKNVEYMHNHINLKDSDDGTIRNNLIHYLKIRTQHAFDKTLPLLDGGGGTGDLIHNINTMMINIYNRRNGDITDIPIISGNPATIADRKEAWNTFYEDPTSITLKDILLELQINGSLYAPSSGQDNDNFIFPHHIGGDKLHTENDINNIIQSPDSLFYYYYKNTNSGPTYCDCTKSSLGEKEYIDTTLISTFDEKYSNSARNDHWNEGAPTFINDVGTSTIKQYRSDSQKNQWGYRCELETDCNKEDNQYTIGGYPIYGSLGHSLDSNKFPGIGLGLSGQANTTGKLTNMLYPDRWNWGEGTNEIITDNHGNILFYDTNPLTGKPNEIAECKYIDPVNNDAIDCVNDTTWGDIGRRRGGSDNDNSLRNISKDSGRLPEYFDPKGHGPLLCDCSYGTKIEVPAESTSHAGELAYNLPAPNSPGYGDYCEHPVNMDRTVGNDIIQPGVQMEAYNAWTSGSPLGICSGSNLQDPPTIRTELLTQWSDRQSSSESKLPIQNVPNQNCMAAVTLDQETIGGKPGTDSNFFIFPQGDNFGYKRWGNCTEQNQNQNDNCSASNINDDGSSSCLCYDGVCREPEILYDSINYVTKDRGGMLFPRQDVSDAFSSELLSGANQHSKTPTSNYANQNDFDSEYKARNIFRLINPQLPSSRAKICSCDILRHGEPGCIYPTQDPCNGNGSYEVDNVGGYTCDCNAGYYGSTCASACSGLNTAHECCWGCGSAHGASPVQTGCSFQKYTNTAADCDKYGWQSIY